MDVHNSLKLPRPPSLRRRTTSIPSKTTRLQRSSMDTTVRDSECPETCGPSQADQFTTANVAGLLLTMTLCLITQPWGSLFFRPPRKDDPGIAQLCFFLWRLNPIASAAEAFFIGASLFDTARDLFHRQRVGSFDRINLFDMASEFRDTAAALLLLRTGGDDPQAPELHLRSAEDASLMSGSDLRASTSQVDTGSSAAVDLVLSGLGAVLSRPANPSGHKTSPAAFSQTGPNDDSDAEARSESCDALSTPKQEWVDRMAIVSVLFTSIKLLAIAAPWHVRFAALAMLMDWLAVQALLVLSSPLFGSSSTPMRRGSVSRHKSLSESLFLGVIFHLVAIPTIVYVSYQISFSLGYPDAATESGYGVIILRRMDQFQSQFAQVLYFILIFPLILPFSLAMLLAMAPIVGPSAFLMIALTEFISDYFEYLVPFPIVLLLGMVFMAAEILVLFRTLPLEEHIGTLAGLVCTVALAAFMYLTCVFPSRTFHKKSNGTTATLVCFSTVLWIYIFYYVLEEYDETGTYKPSWLEYLG